AMGLQNTYHVGEAANFTLVIRGHGIFPCVTPGIKIYNNMAPDRPILDERSEPTLCQQQGQPHDFEFYFPNKTSSFTAFLNQTGNYTLEISYGGRTILDGFSVLPKTSEQQQSIRTVTISGDKGWLVCAAMEVPCPTNPTFQANQTGPDTYVVLFRVNDKPYTVTIKGSSYCVIPAIDPRHTCSEIFQGAFPAIS
ncbi:MAG: hypothetical protein KGI11_10310, partial [Thaumarchaeota archaeon]|nr:hypothetical protein [Nitrososphaerota archaeon]